MLIEPVPEGCPWWDWERPNIKYCEALRCSYITAPANTWSNLAYFVVAAVIAYDVSRGVPAGSTRTAAIFSAALVVVGALSFAFHASYTLVWQFGDFLGMFIFAAVPLVLNLRRLGWLARARQFACGLGVVFVATLIMLHMWATGAKYQFIVVAMVFLVLLQEAVLALRERRRRRHGSSNSRNTTDGPRRGLLVESFVWLLVAFACSAADMARVWCHPHSVVQGHATWHVLSAVALLRLYRFYAYNFVLDARTDVLPLVKRL